MRRKKGDTLIEVALAIGIFSMVAIVVTSVVSASTTGAQSALEVTLTREDIDAQAEALRFIHESYVAGSQSKDISTNSYATLWNTIKNRAMPISSAAYTKYLTYNPATCSSLYNGAGAFTNNAGPANNGYSPFIIDIRRLSNPADVSNIVVASNTTNGKKFFATTTFPRLLYNGQSAANSDSLYNQTEGVGFGNNTISRAEGIYIIAFKGAKTKPTEAAHTNTNIEKKVYAYYDFYIRSCWMPPNAIRASTISTLVRLYDPAVITY